MKSAALPPIGLQTNVRPLLTPNAPPQEELSREWQRYFTRVSMINMDVTDIPNYLQQFRTVERFDDKGHYTKHSFQECHQGRSRRYVKHLLIINQHKDSYYVVDEALHSEHDMLAEYCLCFRCSCAVYNPLKYMWCASCCGCVIAGPGLTRDKYLQWARQLQRGEMTRPWCAMTVIEWALLVLIALWLLYKR